MNEHKNDSIITLPAGLYKMNSDCPFRITGEFSDKMVIADGVVIEPDNSDYPAVVIEGVRNTAIKGLTIFGSGITIAGSKNIVIIKNIFNNCKTALYDDGTQTLSIIDNEFSGDDYPIQLRNTKIAIINNNIYKNKGGTEKAVLNIDDSATQIVGNEIPGKGLKHGEVGVDESRLPQTDKNRFVGITRKTEIDGKSVYDYIMTAYNNECDSVIIPPGTYFIRGELYKPHMVFTNMKSTGKFTIYAYGVLFEFERINGTAFSFVNCEDISLKGLTMDYSQVPNPQGIITDISAGRMTWKADDGYIQDLWDDSLVEYTSFGGNVAEGYRPGSDVPYTDTWSNKSEMEKIGEGLYTIPVKSGLEVGGKMIFRGRFAHVNLFSGCTNIEYEDVTVFAGSGFGFMESEGGGNSHLNRVAFTPGPVPPGGTEERLISTCDATHAVSMREGMKVTNCLFEKMTDDATNNCGKYGTVTKFNSSAKELIYTGGTVFQNGDRALIYAIDGKLLCDATVSSLNGRNLILDKSFAYDSTVKTIIENASANGNNFLYDNCLVQNNRSRGFLIKSPDGTITNCTLKDNGMSSILISPEIADNWGECGFTWNIKITNNRIINGGFFTGSELHSPINITGDKFPLEDSAYYNHGNILIDKNVFEGRYTKYCITANSIDGLKITNNKFGVTNPKASDEIKRLNNTQPVINVQGAQNIEISGNTYPENIKNNLNKVNIGENVMNIRGTDIL